MTKFDWIFDTQNYLANNNQRACKLKLKEFVRNIGHQLDSYKGLSWDDVREKPHHHACDHLSRKKSGAAKKLAKHLEGISLQAGEKEQTQIEPFQIAIKNFANKREYRVFGYNKYHRFHLIYLDPDHEVYKD